MTEKSGYGSGLKARIPQDVAVFNAARGGRSSKSFRAEGHWAELLRHKPHVSALLSKAKDAAEIASADSLAGKVLAIEAEAAPISSKTIPA